MNFLGTLKAGGRDRFDAGRMGGVPTDGVGSALWLYPMSVETAKAKAWRDAREGRRLESDFYVSASSNDAPRGSDEWWLNELEEERRKRGAEQAATKEWWKPPPNATARGGVAHQQQSQQQKQQQQWWRNASIRDGIMQGLPDDKKKDNLEGVSSVQYGYKGLEPLEKFAKAKSENEERTKEVLTDVRSELERRRFAALARRTTMAVQENIAATREAARKARLRHDKAK